MDKTRIAVRERDIFDILDLALHVFRQNFVPLCSAMLIGVIPWFVVNYWLVSWMLPSDFDAPGTPEYNGYLVRYFWNMMVLIVLEMPFAGAIATVYLGEVLFVDQPSLRTSARHVIKAIPALCWHLLVLRGVLASVLLVAVIDRNAPISGMELWLALLFAIVLQRRMVAPFLNEIILLEKVPSTSTDPDEVTVAKRSVMLHRNASGSMVGHTLLITLYAIGLAIGIATTLSLLQGILFGDWPLQIDMPMVGWPLAMWLTATFLTVVRFLRYLDLRIRQEGWEVELRIRAESARLAEL